MLQTITSIVNSQQTVDSLPKRKRVAFDPEGVLLLPLQITDDSDVYGRQAGEEFDQAQYIQNQQV